MKDAAAAVSMADAQRRKAYWIFVVSSRHGNKTAVGDPKAKAAIEARNPTAMA